MIICLEKNNFKGGRILRDRRKLFPTWEQVVYTRGMFKIKGA